ncbi:MAG: suppressor of fused domain protein [Treponema sp.]|jgi:tetratricopeptide (TPR) repeat protein|nr:suppressor of fused domain protein [Treponema sp.]
MIGRNHKHKKLLAQIAIWHNDEQHQKILDAIQEIPREEWDYNLGCIYARALNNVERYQEALEILRGLEEQGKTDGLWYFRVGYALYYLEHEEEAAECFQKAIDYGDDNEDTKMLLLASREEAERKREQVKYNPELYSDEEMECIQSHIDTYFGASGSVFHELVSPDIHVDIVIIEPTEKRNYYVLVTMGMGAHRMNVPDELKEENLARAEVLVCLPPDWNIESKEEEYYWPLRWLKIMARLPGNEDTWIGWGHTVPNGEPFAKNTQLNTILLLNPGAFRQKSFRCKMPDGSYVNFYQMIPLYEEEVQFKIKNNTDLLLSFLDKDCLEYVRIDRDNICKE